MGGCLNIEIHQNLKSSGQFITELNEILKIGLVQEQLNEFIDSIKLCSEKNNSWYEYKKAKFKLNANENNEHLEWDIYLYYNHHNYKHVLELSISETEIQIYEDDCPYFNVNKTKEILHLMSQMHRLKKEAIILFTNEASQGVFVQELNEAKSDINYLFDLAILPINLNWEKSSDNYEKIEKLEKGEIWKSKSRYMRKFLPIDYKVSIK